jgi:NADH-quinone oxidoreductase subunit N
MNGLSILRPELMVLTSQQIATLMPYFLLFGGACIAILFSVLKIMSPKWPVVLVSVAACAAAAWSASSLSCHSTTTLTLFNGMMISDPFSNIFNVLFLVSAAATCLLSIKYLDQENLQHPEYYILILFSSLGMMLMASALDLLVLFISLEIMSLAVYALVGFRRSDRRSNEAAIKYFILGSAASAILLYGVALIYGCTGTTNIQGIFVQSSLGTLPYVDAGCLRRCSHSNYGIYDYGLKSSRICCLYSSIYLSGIWPRAWASASGAYS